MVSFRRKNEEPQDEIQSDSVSSDDSVTEPTLEPVIPQVDPKSGLQRKLFVLQHSFNFSKDSQVSAGRMNYKFTSLQYWWDLVKDYFKRNNLYLYWETKPYGSNSCLVIGTILDLDSNDSMQSSWIVPISKKTSTDKDGSPTETTDMLRDGAYLSYFQRRVLFAMCGLVTGEDAEAEYEAVHKETGTKSASKVSNNVEGW